MKIIVMSDSHRYLKNARCVLKRLEDRVDRVFHLGDMVNDAKTLQTEFPNLPFTIVLGNNDYGEDVEPHEIVMVQGCRLLLTHGHRKMVHWNYDTISYWAEENGADMVLFGHTHSTVNDNGGRVMLVNPGSISQPRDSNIPTFAVITIEEDGNINSSIMEIHGPEDFKIRSAIKGKFVKKV